jgi:hypothetical protein
MTNSGNLRHIIFNRLAISTVFAQRIREEIWMAYYDMSVSSGIFPARSLIGNLVIIIRHELMWPA